MNHLLLSFVLFVTITYTFALHASVRNEVKGQYCIVLDTNISGSVNYFDSFKNKSVLYNFVVNGSSITSDGACHDVQHNVSSEYILINFIPNDLVTSLPISKHWQLKLVFKASEGSNAPTFKLQNYLLSVEFYPEVFNSSILNYNYTSNVESDLEWGAAATHGFTCTKSQLHLSNNSFVQFESLKVIAFAILDTDEFPTDQLFEQCNLDIRTSDLVPIIVGACLAGLVIVVLIAYVIGRARAKRQGYASV